MLEDVFLYNWIPIFFSFCIITIYSPPYDCRMVDTLSSMVDTSSNKKVVHLHFSWAPPLDRRDSLLFVIKISFGKVGVATHFILF